MRRKSITGVRESDGKTRDTGAGRPTAAETVEAARSVSRCVSARPAGCPGRSAETSSSCASSTPKRRACRTACAANI